MLRLIQKSIVRRIGLLMICFWFLLPVNCFAENWFKKGLTLLKDQKYKEAVQAFTLSLEIVPDDYEALNNRGVAWFNTGNYDRAIHDYTRALELRPRYPEAYYNRGAAWFSKGLYILAVLDCMRVLEILPEDREAAQQVALILAVYTGDDTPDISAARKRARKEVATTKDPDFLGALAAAYSKAGKNKEAIKVQERAIRLLQDQKTSEKRAAFASRLDYYRTKIATPKRPVRIIKIKAAEINPEDGEQKGGKKVKEKNFAEVGTSKQGKTSSPVLPEKGFSIQIGAFLKRENAEEIQAALMAKGYKPFLFIRPDLKGNIWYTVRMGVYETRREAMNAGTKFFTKERIPTIVRPANSL